MVPTKALLAIVVVMVLIATVVVFPYSTRADDYANDPTDPPDEVIDGGGSGDDDDDDDGDDDVDLNPDWQGKFTIKALATAGWSSFVEDYVVSSIKVTKLDLALEDYDGQPWSAASMWAAAFGQFRPAPEFYTVKWELAISKGDTTYEDDGSFRVIKGTDTEYTGSGLSKYFFFWEEQDGSWTYSLKLTCKRRTTTDTGTITLTRGSVVVS
jgi:hypothetical protein